MPLQILANFWAERWPFKPALAAATILLSTTMAYADALELTCKRSDVVNALDYFYLIDTAASKVSDASGPVEKKHTYFARITNTAIDWTDIGGATYHIDRLSGHMTMVNRAGTFEFNCRKAQGF